MQNTALSLNPSMKRVLGPNKSNFLNLALVKQKSDFKGKFKSNFAREISKQDRTKPLGNIFLINKRAFLLYKMLANELECFFVEIQKGP